MLPQGNTAQRASSDFARHLLADFPSYCPEIPCNTTAFEAGFCPRTKECRTKINCDRQYACGISMQSAEKSDYASYAQALFSVAPEKTKKRTSRLALFQNRIISGIGYSTTPFCSSRARAVSTESTPTAFFTGANSLLRSTSNARQLSCMCTISSTSVSNL